MKNVDRVQIMMKTERNLLKSKMNSAIPKKIKNTNAIYWLYHTGNIDNGRIPEIKTRGIAELIKKRYFFNLFYLSRGGFYPPS